MGNSVFCCADDGHDPKELVVIGAMVAGASSMTGINASRLSQKALDSHNGAVAPPSLDKSDCESVTTDVSYISEVSTSTGIGGMQRYQLVDFVRQLVRGHPITLLKEAPYEPFVERCLATMRLTRDLAAITISGDDLRIAVALADITHVYTAQADGGEHLPKRIVDHLTPGELERTTRVFHALPDGREMAFIFTDAGAKWVKLFPKALKALLKRAGRRELERGRLARGRLTADALHAAATQTTRSRRSA
mmetsp:Transcript_31068/g.88661  ORF Transcript_31068/g.88661 Transcript_31068/m.88661 type:complete len:249 (+) Transcript_31068:48-794(+)